MDTEIKFVTPSVSHQQGVGKRRTQAQLQAFMDELALHPGRWAIYSTHASKSSAHSRAHECRSAERFSQYPVEWTTSQDDANGIYLAVRWVGDPPNGAAAPTQTVVHEWGASFPAPQNVSDIPPGSVALHPRTNIPFLLDVDENDTAWWFGLDEDNVPQALTHDQEAHEMRIIYTPKLIRE